VRFCPSSAPPADSYEYMLSPAVANTLGALEEY